MRTKRVVGWDILRIALALIVFAFHSNIHIGINYRFLTGFISVGALCMTGFFMLSGTVLYHTHNEDAFDHNSIFQFYYSRIRSIYPVYIFAFILFHIDNGFSRSDIALIPIEVFGLQSVFSGSFTLSFNGGAWFVSCLLICYFLFPLIRFVLRKFNKYALVFLLIFLSIFDIYLQFLCHYYSFGELYSAPFIRCIQFIIGCIIGALFKQGLFRYKTVISLLGTICSFGLLVVVTCILVNYGWANDSIYLQRLAMFDVVAVPCFILLIVFLGSALNKEFKAITIISNLSYTFFFAQLFVWKHSLWLFELFGIKRNVFKLLISFAVCIILSLLFHFLIEIPFEKVNDRIIRKIKTNFAFLPEKI